MLFPTVTISTDTVITPVPAKGVINFYTRQGFQVEHEVDERIETFTIYKDNGEDVDVKELLLAYPWENPENVLATYFHGVPEGVRMSAADYISQEVFTYRIDENGEVRVLN